MKRTPGQLVSILLIALILLIPLILTSAWGMNLAGDAYLLLQYARALAEGSSTILAAAAEGAAARAPSMLFTLLVSAPALLGVEPAAAAAVLSALGWSATAFAFLAVGKGINRLPGAAISALLLCFNPIILTSSGTPASWVVALIWWAAAFLLARRYFLMLAAILALALLLLPLPPGPPVLQTALAGAFAWSLLIFLVGLGAEIAARWFAANGETAGKSRLVFRLALALVFVLAGAYQLSVLNGLFQTKPEARWALENDVAAWIKENTPANAVIGASEKVGYLANRRTVPLPAPGSSPPLKEELLARPPTYLVSNDTLPWQLVANSRWFRLNYQAQTEFTAPYVAAAPYTIWRYQPPPADLGFAQALNARVPNRLRILGYQVNQADLQAANEALITLYLEAAANTIEPVTNFAVKTRLLSPADGQTLAEWDAVLPGSVAPGDWQPGEKIREQILIGPLPDLEPGAYPLNISLAGPESPEFWPISLDNDLERLDRLQVGYLVVPAAVDETMIQRSEATFAGQIKLLGYSMSAPRPGEGLDLTLFWEASEPLGEDAAALNVFTHVLDGSGQLVANHDGVPGNGRYPVSSWLPGNTIVDAHVIQLPPDLPGGDYDIRVGLYDPESGERLPVVAGDGTAAPDQAFLLTEFSIATSQ